MFNRTKKSKYYVNTARNIIDTYFRKPTRFYVCVEQKQTTEKASEEKPWDFNFPLII